MIPILLHKILSLTGNAIFFKYIDSLLQLTTLHFLDSDFAGQAREYNRSYNRE